MEDFECLSKEFGCYFMADKEPLWALGQGINLIKIVFKEFVLDTVMNG